MNAKDEVVNNDVNAYDSDENWTGNKENSPDTHKRRLEMIFLGY